MILEKLANFTHRHDTPENTDYSAEKTPQSPVYSAELIPRYKDENNRVKKGIRATLDWMADEFFKILGYDPRNDPVGYVQEVDHNIFEVYRALRGDAKPLELNEAGSWYAKQRRQQWYIRGQRIKSLIGTRDDKSGLLYNLGEALDKGEMSEIGAILRFRMLNEMFDVALRKNIYLKRRYGECLEKANFYKDSLESLENVRNLVNNYEPDYNWVFTIENFREWKPIAAILDKAQPYYNRGKAMVLAVGSGVQRTLNTMNGWYKGGMQKVKSLKFPHRKIPPGTIDLNDFLFGKCTTDDIRTAEVEQEVPEPDARVIPFPDGEKLAESASRSDDEQSGENQSKRIRFKHFGVF